MTKLIFEVRQLSLKLNYDEKDVIDAICRKLDCKREQIINWEITRRSLDSRPIHSSPVYSINAKVNLKPTFQPKKKNNDIVKITENFSEFKYIYKQFDKSPVIIGAGVAGLMASYYFAKAGSRPILLEKGCKAEERIKFVRNFWENGILDLNSNILYGEGGAGLFSDGKLTARSKDRGRIHEFFKILVECGAKTDILIDAEPHIGSDILLKIIPEIRKKIIELGGSIYHNTPVTDLIINNNKIEKVITNNNVFSTDTVILATGHSARDVYKLLSDNKVCLEAKPFSVGIRLEIPQIEINKSRYKNHGNSLLEAANFKLTRLPENGARACYTFCMCPGGVVIPCANEHNMLTTNGMSYSSRSLPYGNAAFLVPVNPEDYAHCSGKYKASELFGLNFQEKIEFAAYKYGGENYSLPALMFNDFLTANISNSLPKNRSCIRSIPASFDLILPEFVIKTLRYQIPFMLSQLKEVNPNDVIVYAAETRSSSPVRILRNDKGESINIKGLYPIGEGSGYSGGIVSSAIDGLKTAELISKYN